MLAGIEAKRTDTKQDPDYDPDVEVWRGKVGGVQNVDIYINKHPVRVIKGKDAPEEIIPTLSIWAQRAGDSPGLAVAETATRAVLEFGKQEDTGTGMTDEQVDSLMEVAQNATEEALSTVRRRQARRRKFESVRRIFGGRQKQPDQDQAE